MLSVQNLQCSYGDIVALHDLSFEARAGEIFALIGANGAGKTTTIMALAGHLFPRSGSILIEGNDVTSIGPRGRLARGVALVPEGRRVFADLSVDDNQNWRRIVRVFIQRFLVLPNAVHNWRVLFLVVSSKCLRLAGQ